MIQPHAFLYCHTGRPSEKMIDQLVGEGYRVYIRNSDFFKTNELEVGKVVVDSNVSEAKKALILKTYGIEEPKEVPVSPPEEEEFFKELEAKQTSTITVETPRTRRRRGEPK